ncbi:MAG: hypothetical protein NVS4B8_21650 [Herpetosiphon sp.]
MKSILVVEDEPAVAEVLLAILEDAGYEVILAFNGADALDRMADRTPHLILSDVKMPLVNGWELCRAIQEDARWKLIPFVLMSASLEQVVPPGCRCAAIIGKPFMLKELLATIASLLR